MIRDDLSNADYHVSEGISSSDVKTVLMESVWHWHNKVINGRMQWMSELPCMIFG